MLSKKKMRNIMINKIDKILMKYYKEIDFEKIGCESNTINAYRDEAMELIDLMKELELVNLSEYIVLRDVYGDYFWLHES